MKLLIQTSIELVIIRLFIILVYLIILKMVLTRYQIFPDKQFINGLLTGYYLKSNITQSKQQKQSM